MNRVVRYTFAALCCTLWVIGVAHGEVVELYDSYDRAQKMSAWSDGRNVTGLLLDTNTISDVEVAYAGAQGSFRNFSDAAQEWSVGAEARSRVHYDRVSMIGSFSYEHWEGADMCGSMFISPNSYPVDVLEFTPGDKRLQSYALMGGISSQLSSRWSIGVMGEFGAQNYAKFKDLRHYNYRMELSLMPSLSYRLHGGAVLGLSYIYSRNAESIRAQEVGSSVAAYYAFLNKGLMSGAYETWGGTGVHLDESGIDGFPVRENFHGAALQVESGAFFAEVEYLHGRGSVGEKLTYWFDFPSNMYSARVGYSRERGGALHLFQLAMQYYTITNSENVLGVEVNNGVSTTVIYGSNDIFSSSQLSLLPRYRVLSLHSCREVEVGVNYYGTHSRATLMYPYVEELDTQVIQIYAGGVLPLGVHSGVELRCRALFSTGLCYGVSSVVSEDVLVGDAPVRLEEYYAIDNEFLTATYVSGSAAVRYTHKLGLYMEVGATYTQAFDLQYIEGSSRLGYSVGVGYKF